MEGLDVGLNHPGSSINSFASSNYLPLRVANYQSNLGSVYQSNLVRIHALYMTSKLMP